MKRFHCDCGQAVFFENSSCVHCGARLGFDPDVMEIVTLSPTADDTLTDADGKTYRYCSNQPDYDACNWLRPVDSENRLCRACQFNRTVPNLSRPRNLARWRRFEFAKKRLFFTLIQLRLPLRDGFSAPHDGLVFDFVEDERSDYRQYPESFIQTGFHGGVITINSLEADDSMRESVKAELNESYRTLLGHLRHESGHYYWAIADADDVLHARFKQVFGDDGIDYAGALEQHYAKGPPSDWPEQYISAYASAHPSEDWAESWGNYLYIHDALETAAAYGLLLREPASMDVDERLDAWRSFSIALNELNRSGGLGDPYPFVVNEIVKGKLEFVDSVMSLLRERNPAPADH